MTRKSVIQLARHKGYEVEEGDCPIAEALEADEIFTCGTAVVVLSVGSITYKVGASSIKQVGLRRGCLRDSQLGTITCAVGLVPIEVS